MVRPRSETAHRKVLEAALELFSNDGIDATSMDAIATASGVSKATIYKHWPHKDKLALEALLWLHGLDEPPPQFDSGNLRDDLIATLAYQPARRRADMKKRLMPHLIAYSARNPVFGKEWRKRVLEIQRVQITTLIETGIRRGTISRGTRIDTAMALLMGPLIYRHIFVDHKRIGKPPRPFIAQIVDAFLTASRPA